jgi:poly(A) polymerase
MLDIILTLAERFRAGGFELYMVGGTVRDLLLRRAVPADADLTTNARPDDIKRLAASTHPVAVVTVGEQFGTVRLHYRRAAAESAATMATVDAAASPFAPQREDGGARPLSGGQGGGTSSPLPAAVVADHAPDVDVVEITTYRSDRYDPVSRKPEVTFGDTLEGDLLRRDFTINAMARDPLTGAIFDPYGGRADLERGLLRAVGDDPKRRFDEDPLRMLRAGRFAAQLAFEIEPKTADAIRRQAGALAKISRERIRDELTKLLVSPNPALGLRLLVDLGLMEYIVPEVLELRGVSQRPGAAGHSKDVYAHVLRVVERTPPRPATRWAGLLHDIAKPRTRSVAEGHVHFFGHEDLGAVMARDILRRLKFDRPFIDHVVLLVKLHMRANAYETDWTDGAVRRLMLDVGDALPDLLDLSRADITSYRQDKVSRAVARVNELEARCKWLLEEAARVPIRSPLDGNDLMALFDRGPGPWLRPVKDYLLGLVIDGELAPDDRAEAEKRARAFVAELDNQAAHAAHTPSPLPPSPAVANGSEGTVEGGPPSNKRAARAAQRRQSRHAAVQPPRPAEEPRAGATPGTP